MTSQERTELIEAARVFLDELFSTGVPLQELLNHGTFPEGWPERYCAFVEQVSACHDANEPLPREVVAVIYNASVYCTKRYNDWCSHWGSKNPATFDQVNQVRWAGDRLVLGPFYPIAEN
ncbi:MAG: hypothetical protein AAGF84_08750 [Planctomycetota bacterium]